MIIKNGAKAWHVEHPTEGRAVQVVIDSCDVWGGRVTVTRGNRSMYVCIDNLFPTMEAARSSFHAEKALKMKSLQARLDAMGDLQFRSYELDEELMV